MKHARTVLGKTGAGNSKSPCPERLVLSIRESRFGGGLRYFLRERLG